MGSQYPNSTFDSLYWWPDDDLLTGQNMKPIYSNKYLLCWCISVILSHTSLEHFVMPSLKMSSFHNDTITQQLMIPDQQPKYFAWDSSRDGLPAAFITSHNTKQHALGSKRQLITLHKYAAVSRDHKHPSREDIGRNTQQVCEQTSSWLLHKYQFKTN